MAILTSHAFSPKDDALGLTEMFNFTIVVSNVKRNNIISTTITGWPFLREKKIEPTDVKYLQIDHDPMSKSC